MAVSYSSNSENLKLLQEALGLILAFFRPKILSWGLFINQPKRTKHLQTFLEPKEFVENPSYQEQRKIILAGLADVMIDFPIIESINGFNKLPYCFTMQNCYGHFLYRNQKDIHSLDRLPVTNTITRVEYRIAYIAFCIENSMLGKSLFVALKKVTDIDPKNIQL